MSLREVLFLYERAYVIVYDEDLEKEVHFALYAYKTIENTNTH